MRVVSREAIDAAMTMPAMVEALRDAFRGAVVQPVRHHHEIEHPDALASTLLIMPAWTDFMAVGRSEGGYCGVKIVTVAPDNHRHGKASVLGSYLLMSGVTGEPLAVLDGQALTLWRTAAASALAASYLARTDARRHLMVGAGSLAPYLIQAMRAVRPIEETLVWNRRADKAAALARELSAKGLNVRAVDDLGAAVESADIVSAATLSREPLIEGRRLKEGVHLDLVGAFNPEMRESDNEAVRRARLYVDTRGGALKEGGDLVQAIAAGAARAEDIIGDLFELARGTAEGRRDAREITLFKSVGAALEDLAAAILVYERL